MRKRGAAAKSKIIDIGHRRRDRDGDEPGAVGKSTVADPGHGGGDADRSQSRISVEFVISDLRDRIRYDDLSDEEL